MKDDPDLIPASYRIKLDLNVCKETITSQGYLALSARKNEVIKACHTKLRDLVVECTKLNVNELNNDALKSFVTNVPLIIEAFLIYANILKYNKHHVFVDLLENDYTENYLELGSYSRGS